MSSEPGSAQDSGQLLEDRQSGQQDLEDRKLADSKQEKKPSRWAIDVRPLRVPAYRRLWIGNGVSMYGMQFTAVAVPVEMYTLTHDSFWVGLLGLTTLVPLVIFGIWGGAVADVVDRRKLLLVSTALLWLTTLGLLAQAVFRVGSPVLLLALVAVQSAAFGISSPARQAIITRLVPTPLVPAALTLGFTTAQAAGVAGPLTAGLIFSAWAPETGLPLAYGVDALLFTVSLWATYRLPSLAPLAESEGGEVDANAPPAARRAGLRSIADGFRYLATTPVLLLSFGIDLIAMVLAMPRSLFPEVAQERFGGGAAIGLLYSAIAIGSVLGGLTSGWIGRIERQGLALVVAVVGWGVSIAFAGLAHQLWLVVGLLALAGAADLVSSVFRQSMLQVYVPDRMRGRLQGVNITVVAGGPRLGDLRAGLMASSLGVGVAWVGGGLAVVVLAPLLALAFPALMRYRAPATPAD
ncbi:putative MFS family arabinose efflux permease [Micromonospora pisi]|uniref:Putative MFS family arabinose efflux permease n=1 Tax=Micromonospora pisi TaxID=589240 RepID=A0A495JLD3_9ACTN|nr:MFS transporter [Micromonospora pisi]RKR89860.1 putative MFS family arabinose efflux permease [Micromonospora pisi]